MKGLYHGNLFCSILVHQNRYSILSVVCYNKPNAWNGRVAEALSPREDLYGERICKGPGEHGPGAVRKKRRNGRNRYFLEAGRRLRIQVVPRSAAFVLWQPLFYFPGLAAGIGTGTENREDTDMRQGTKCVQAGYRPGNGEPRQIPIVQSTTFRYDTSEDMGKLFDLEAEGYFYSRLQNPTNDTVAAKICALEGGSAAMLTSSGQAANFMALFNIAGAGDHIVASSSIYGGTFNLIGTTMKRMGVDVTFLSPDSTYEEIRAAIRPNTKAVFGETIANPALTVLDIETWAKAAHDGGVPLVIDNTFATPVLCRPIEHGADIVTHSTTKYMDGHGASIGGAIIDSGNFDWTQNDRFPGLTTPDESYHGVVYTEKFGQGGAYITKATSQLMRDLGCVQSPQNAFYINLGLESLHLRMKRHSETALAVAQFLDSHPKVEAVQYAGLPGDKYHALAEKYLPDGCCGVVSFEIKGGRAAAERVMKALKTAAIETHVADARSCCLHPASATHRQMTDEQLTECGISPSMIRFSCGLEDAQDLIDDLAQALEQA